MRDAGFSTMAALMAIGFAFGPTAVIAQVPTHQGVVAGCAGSEAACSDLVAAYAASLQATGATQAAIDRAMTDLAVALGNAAQNTASMAARAEYATGIREAATYVASADQRDRLNDVALAVEAGPDIPAVAASAA